jgi:hypothetical protein
MRTALIIIAVTSAIWLAIMASAMIKWIAEKKELRRQNAVLKNTITGLQTQITRWRKTNEKMETGNNNSDFTASLDILQNARHTEARANKH